MRIVRTARLIKLVRLMRGSRVLSRWRTRISISFARLSIISLTFEILLTSHWLACMLALQAGFGRLVDSWFGTFGWCAEDTMAEVADAEVCVPIGELYLVCLNWAFFIVAGFGKAPEYGPYPPAVPEEDVRFRSGGGLRFNVPEQITALVWTILSALGRAYITAKLVEIIAHGNPDWTAFKHRMDQLNRYISFYRLEPQTAQQLREWADCYSARTDGL